jgi:hypothetical protein
MPGRILAVDRCPDLSGLYASSEFLVEKGPTLSSERRIGCLFRFSWRISGMARFQSRENAGHFGWILQKENDEARHDLSTGARRSALLWLDRRGSQRVRSREIHDSVLPAEAKLKRLASLIAESERNRRIAAVTGVAA